MNFRYSNGIRRRKPDQITIVAVIFLSVLCRISQGTESTVDAFERYATEFKFFGDHEFLFGRTEIYLADPAAMRSYRPILKEFMGRHDAVEDLIPLLHNPNPKVRVLAIMALYAGGADHALPEINQLVDDEHPAFTNPPYDQQGLRFSGIGPPQESQTVGEAATNVIHFLRERRVGR